jgi:hypothetical protein
MGGEVRAREQRHADDCIRVQRDAFDKLPYTVRREARKPTQFSSEAKPWRHKDLLSAGGYRLIKHSLGYGPFRRLGNNRAIVARRYAEEVERRAKVEHRYSSATAVVSSGRQIARRQAVHRRRRRMHLGRACRQGEREVPGQSPQILVPQPRSDHHGRRLRGHLPSEAAAALFARAARFRPVAGLSVPRVIARYARPSDRHGTVQIR